MAQFGQVLNYSSYVNGEKLPLATWDSRTGTVTGTGWSVQDNLKSNILCITPSGVGANYYTQIGYSEDEMIDIIWEGVPSDPDIGLGRVFTIPDRIMSHPVIYLNTSDNEISPPIANELYQPPAEIINITCGTSDATIRYTINGLEPSESSTLYEGNFEIDAPATIKAKGFKTGWIESDVVSYEVETPMQKLPDPEL